MTDEELLDMAHTIMLRMATRGGFDAYTGARLHKWLKEYENRQTQRVADGLAGSALDNLSKKVRGIADKIESRTRRR